jgi:nucleotide-binding universal stress UspA family protein
MSGVDRHEMPDIDSFVFLTTKPKETAVKIAKDLGCTAIFVGSKSEAKGILQGAFSKYVAEHAHCDTIVIKHHVSSRTFLFPFSILGLGLVVFVLSLN